MLNSIQSKIIGLLIIIMAITAFVLIFVSNREIGDAMLDQQDKLSRHVLSLIDLNIKGGYQNLIADKIDSVDRQKALLKARTMLVVRMINGQRESISKKLLSDESGRQIVREWINHSQTETFGTLFIADSDLNILAHPDPDFKDVNIGNFTNMKRETLTELLDTKGFGGEPVMDVVTQQLPGKSRDFEKKILICLYKYPPWGWVVGTMSDINAIEVEAQKKLEKIVESLKESFTKITIAETGFPFLFNNEHKILAIGRTGFGPDFQNAVNLDDNSLLLQDMVTAVKKKNGILSYRSNVFGTQEMVAYALYFKPLGWYMGITVPVSETKQPAAAIASKQSVRIGVILFVGILLMAWVVSRISKPINTLTFWVQEFSKSDLTQKEEEEDIHIQKLANRYKDEVGHLAQAFVFMKKQLRDNIVKLMKTTSENERMNAELGVAKTIQLGLLPKVFPPFVDRSDIGVYASLEPAKAVGGDLYDFYFVGEDRLCFTIGDVSGKGVPAALMMAITKTLIKMSATRCASPAEIMMEVNNAVAADNPETMFVTLFIGILDLKTGRVTYSNGGHNPPILVSTMRPCKYVRKISGPVVGIKENISYEELSLDLAPGEGLFLYTDGVTEAQNTSKQFYSEQALIEKMIFLAGETCEQTIREIKTDLVNFTGAEPQYDDIAMLMLRYRGGNHES
ncbi:SpoIIE family protein phosphatase [uncultured Desulfobacter sp.]|uniref:SpoIIE family protein phosphatase n=1 Tax=uncultured Desulfobacter sp. TaxID=240139 RepID=UPI002AAB0093|nr:SpoIIE family protein phosphatase [uncultured Desulfobacter sp.]